MGNALLIPTIMTLMISVRRHYDREQVETAKPAPLDLSNLREPLVVFPILRWTKSLKKACDLR